MAKKRKPLRANKNRRFSVKRKLREAYVIIVDGNTERSYFNQMAETEGLSVKIRPELARSRSLEDFGRIIEEKLTNS